MTVPIYIDGKEAGTLAVERQGPVTVMTADMADVGRVVRLTVYGGGKAGYLGVPAPVDGRLRLTKRLSPNQMRAFPQKPEYAAERPREVKKAPTPPALPAPETQDGGEQEGHVLWMGGKPHYF